MRKAHFLKFYTGTMLGQVLQWDQRAKQCTQHALPRHSRSLTNSACLSLDVHTAQSHIVTAASQDGTISLIDFRMASSQEGSLSSARTAVLRTLDCKQQSVVWAVRFICVFMAIDFCSGEIRLRIINRRWQRQRTSTVVVARKQRHRRILAQQI